MTMVDLVVNYIEFVHIRPLNKVFILMGVFKVDFTGWLFLNRGQKYVVRKTMIDLVANHNEFAHIWPLNMVFIGVFKVDFTGWSVFQPRSKPSG